MPPDLPYLGVAFSHTAHARFGYEECSTCHNGFIFAEEARLGANPITMEGINAGRWCGYCHDGKSRYRRTLVPAADVDAEIFGPVTVGVELCVLCHCVKKRTPAPDDPPAAQ